MRETPEIGKNAYQQRSRVPLSVTDVGALCGKHRELQMHIPLRFEPPEMKFPGGPRVNAERDKLNFQLGPLPEFQFCGGGKITPSRVTCTPMKAEKHPTIPNDQSSQFYPF